MHVASFVRVSFPVGNVCVFQHMQRAMMMQRAHTFVTLTRRFESSHTWDVGIRWATRTHRDLTPHRSPSDHQTALPLHVPFVLGLPSGTLMVPTGPNHRRSISTVQRSRLASRPRDSLGQRLYRVESCRRARAEYYKATPSRVSGCRVQVAACRTGAAR